MSKINSHKRAKRRLLREPHACHYCGAPATTVDHVVPLASGGTHAVINTVPACRPCNEQKGQSMYESHCQGCADAWTYARKMRSKSDND